MTYLTSDYIRTHVLSEHQIRQAIANLKRKDIGYETARRSVIALVETQSLPKDVMVFLVKEWTTSTFDVPVVAPEIIDAGLSSSSRFARREAYRHPCCTEAQKVRYNLTYGK